MDSGAINLWRRYIHWTPVIPHLFDTVSGRIESSLASCDGGTEYANSRP